LRHTAFLLSFQHSFFLSSYALSMFVQTEIQSAPVFVRSEIQSAIHRAIVTLQLFELTALLSSITFATLATSPIKDPSAPNIGRNGNAPPRFAVGSIRFFVAFFLIIFFGFMPMPILVLAFIAAQTAGSCSGSLAQSRISQ